MERATLHRERKTHRGLGGTEGINTCAKFPLVLLVPPWGEFSGESEGQAPAPPLGQEVYRETWRAGRKEPAHQFKFKKKREGNKVQNQILLPLCCRMPEKFKCKIHSV